MIKLKCKYDKTIFLNLEEFLNLTSLKHADNIRTVFLPDNLNQFYDNNNCNTILKDLDVEILDWLELLSFLKYDKIINTPINNSPYELENFISKLEKINSICNKFGGYHKFDQYYTNESNKCKEIISYYYNPSEPVKDFKNEYDWTLCSLTNSAKLQITFNKICLDNGWSSTKTFTKNNESFVWFRKKKINQMS